MSGTNATAEPNPGTAEVIGSGGATTKLKVTTSGDTVIASGGLKANFAASATTSKKTHSTLVLITGGTVWLSASGFLRGSVIDIYASSKGTLLGSAVTRSNGPYSATVRVPVRLAIGSDAI
jgi:hypothetical protein